MAKTTFETTKIETEVETEVEKIEQALAMARGACGKEGSPHALVEREIDKLVFLTEKDLARRWGVSAKMLQRRRYDGTGVPFYKLGSAVRYLLQDILIYERDHLRQSTSDGGCDAE